MTRLAVLLAVTSLALNSNPVLGQVTLRTVATTGTQAPNFPVSVVYAGFRTPTINDSGQVAFAAELNGPGVPQVGATAVFVGDNNSEFQTPVRFGEQVVGLPAGVLYESFDDVKINNSGAIAFPATLTGLGVDSFYSRAVIRYSQDAGATSVISYGDQAPGLPEGSIVNRVGYRVDFNDRGQIALEASTSAPGSWYESTFLAPGSYAELTTVARRGDQISGLPQGMRYDALWSRWLNDRGDLAYIASVSNSDTPGIGSPPMGLFVHRGDGESTSVLMSGGQAPGMPNGTNIFFSNFSFPTFNNVGKVVLPAGLQGEGIGPENNGALFSDSDGNGMAPIARTGDQVPSMGAVITYSSFFSPQINDEGQIMFTASLAGPAVTSLNDIALFRRDNNGEVAIVARRGDEAPGFSKRVIFTGFDTFTYRLNNKGTAAFTAGLRDGQSTFSGLFLADENGVVHLVAAERHPVDIAAGATGGGSNVVSSITSFDLNNADELVFNARYFNTPGQILVASLPVPEPTAIALVATACLSTVRRHYHGVLTRIPR